MSDSEEQPTLFEINESHLDTGLRGVPVGTCKTSFVSSTKGVHYVGYPISDLADMSPEDISSYCLRKGYQIGKNHRVSLKIWPHVLKKCLQAPFGY